MREGFLGTAVILLFAAASSGAAGWFIDIEAGAAFPGYNDVQVPNDSTGTRFSLTDALDVPAVATWRLRIGLTAGKHDFSILAAPLSLTGDGVLEEDVRFRGAMFTQGTHVNGLYRFDSYRLTWRWRLVDDPQWQFAAGLTAKIRDAEIRLEGGGHQESETNTGFVPLLSFALAWSPCGKVGLLLEGDALVGPVGRAEDVFLGGTLAFSDRLRLRLGARVVEGGADVESVYNFTLVSSITAGATYTL